MKRYFITATGTEMGKTLITAALAFQARQKGLRVTALKPIASGVDEQNLRASDGGQLLRALGLPMSEIDRISAWRFLAPLSPDMAAQTEGRSLALAEIIAFCNAPAQAELQLIEGAGGVMTPLNADHTMLDLMEALSIPVILVAGSYVGTISHTLTALAALKSRDVAVKAIIVNESPDSAASLAQTEASLGRHIDAQIMLKIVQRLDSSPELWKTTPDITEGLV